MSLLKVKADDFYLGTAEFSEDLIKDLTSENLARVEGETVYINKYEIYKLLQDNKIVLIDQNGEIINTEKYFKKYKNVLSLKLESVLVYLELRQKQLKVRESGSKIFEFIAGDERGEKYYIKIILEGNKYTFNDLQKFIKTSIMRKKEPLLAIVERDGEVIFYKLFELKGEEIESDH